MSVDRNRRAAYASAAGVAQRLLQMLSTLITLPLVLHHWGLVQFGIWGAAASLAWLSSILDLGLGGALVTLLPSVIAAQRFDVARAYVTGALVASVAVAAMGGALGILVVLICTKEPETSALLVAVVGLAINAPLSIASSAWFGLQRGSVAAGWELAQTLLTVLFLILAAVYGGSVLAAVAAVYGSLIVTNFASLVHLMIRHAGVRPNSLRVSARVFKTIMGRGSLFFAISGAIACSYVFDNLATLTWLGPVASAQIAVALRICTTAAGLIVVVTQSLLPAFVEALAVGDRPWAMHTLRWGTLLVAAGAVCEGGLVVVFGSVVMRSWFQTDLGISADMLAAIAAWIVVWCLPRVAGLLFNAALLLRPQLIAFVLCASLGFLLKFLLAHRYGVAGILASTPISWLLVVWPTYCWLGWRWLREPASFHPVPGYPKGAIH